MTSALAQPQVQYFLEVKMLDGNVRRYQLVSKQIDIGRGSENHVIIDNDPKVSRKHVQIIYSPQGFEAINVSSQNQVLLNNQEIERAFLAPGAVLQIGETLLRFFAVSVAPKSQPPGLIGQTSHSPSSVSRPPHFGTPRGGGMGRTMNQKRIRLYVIIAAIGLLLFWLLNDTSKKDNKETEIRSTLKIDADIEAAEQLQKAQDEELKQTGEGTLEYKEAQVHFLTGFRDYKKGQYERAIESFQACLSIFPKHQLCQRYSRLSQVRFNEIIQYNMVLGRKYLSQNQFRACTTAFRNVKVMIRDQSSKIYQEAIANYNVCRSQLEGRY